MRIWLDDIRDPPDPKSDWVICRTAEECIGLIWLADDPIEMISFDHDLGEDRGTGYDVAAFLEHCAATYGRYQEGLSVRLPQAWSIHSANPVGCKNIQAAMESMVKFLTYP